MFVVISDLHFQDMQTDSLEHPAGTPPLSVERNVDPEAFRQTFAGLVDLARRNKAQEFVVVLAGGIFDLHRSQHWFTDGGTIRPYGEHPPVRWEPVARTIFEGILESNADVFPMFRTLARERRVPAADGSGDPLAQLPDAMSFRFTYLPGNHDRLVNLSPALRAQVREVLGLDGAPDRPFPQALAWEEYGVFIRHGHEYDPHNFAGRMLEQGPFEVDPQAYAAAPVGEYVTIDIAVHLAFEYRRRYAAALVRGPDAEAHRRVYRKLLELDDLRPQAELAAFMEAELGAGRHEVWQWLWPVLLDVVQEAFASEFLRGWLTRLNPLGPDVHDFLRYRLDPTAWHHLTQFFPTRLVGSLMAALAGREPSGPRPWQRAGPEPVLRNPRTAISWPATRTPPGWSS